ncbi:MAG TPA: serine/threonine-protein kinase [Paraburkholderia sp.]|jgi:serine/threonine-protein kinase
MANVGDPFVGKVIDGRYEIQARVGEGGMGVVYRARQMSIDRVIALKMLNSQMQGDQQWVQRFYNEAKACSRLQHPNTIRMFDFGQTQDGRLFMTMEFLDGMSLRDALQRGPLAAHRVAKVLIQCCASLAEAHGIGIIHRDIKPDNVFLLNMAGSPDFVKLLDFSVAKLLEGDRMKTQAGVVFGTPQYMSPEQGRGVPLDARSDLYALGVLAYEMLVGTVPFNDENPMIVIQMQREAAVPPMPESIPYPIQMVVRRALEKDPARRYQSAGEMMQHCQQVFSELNGGGVSVGGGGVPRTMIAPNMQAAMQQQMPMHQPQAMGGLAAQQPQYQAAGAQAKTMIAQPSPFAGGVPGIANGMPQGTMPQNAGPSNAGGFVQANPMQKTIVAGMAPQIVGGQIVGPPGQMPMQQMQPMQQPGGGNKTVMLQPTDGIVSVARQSGAVSQQGMHAPDMGATPLFWVISLLIGVAIGVVAYVIVLQV